MNSILRNRKFPIYYLGFTIWSFVTLSYLSSIYILNGKYFSYKTFIVPALVFWGSAITFLLLFSALKLNNISLSKNILFKAILAGTSIYLLQYLAEFIWLLYNKQNYRPAYLQNFSSLSLYQLYHPADLPSYLIYPMQTINLWEMLYIITIVFVAKKLTENQIPKLGRTLAITYCLELFSWFVIVTFINLLNQPA
ncbi:hypothetical protein [Pedobacter sp. SL55]|uniref:hypothetical protein n=1 Tax=Pedobacter sp. SL55 TaxID=2995161 RepID=UPI00226D8871|nr:hypothetical protein [Pedobacter sp. SL55]WAC42104.1 hypothetical protein OVA16_07050 [Pedobacter sp. SL55]